MEQQKATRGLCVSKWLKQVLRCTYRNQESTRSIKHETWPAPLHIDVQNLLQTDTMWKLFIQVHTCGLVHEYWGLYERLSWFEVHAVQRVQQEFHSLKSISCFLAQFFQINFFWNRYYTKKGSRSSLNCRHRTEFRMMHACMYQHVHHNW